MIHRTSLASVTVGVSANVACYFSAGHRWRPHPVGINGTNWFPAGFSAFYFYNAFVMRWATAVSRQ
jgi:hypothetical protein